MILRSILNHGDSILNDHMHCVTLDHTHFTNNGQMHSVVLDDKYLTKKYCLYGGILDRTHFNHSRLAVSSLRLGFIGPPFPNQAANAPAANANQTPPPLALARPFFSAIEVKTGLCGL